MQLPKDEIGISDILSWRDCPRRFSLSMKRWTEEGEPPEAESPATAYGSAIHEVFRLIEQDDMDDEAAVQAAFDRWGKWLEPEHLERMRDDLTTYHERDPLGVRLIGAEIDVRVPLLQHEGRTIYFRGQIDRLYQRLDSEGIFIHRDYKSSKWPRTEAEIHADLQMWAYNFLIHEFWPECDTLLQVYDQLRFGELTTRKNDTQRAQIKEWLVKQVTAILNDESYEDDGLLKPSFNEWCPYCPLMESCSVVEQLSEFPRARIAALSGIAEEEKLDPERITSYVERLEDAANARKTLEAYEKSVRALLKELPDDERSELGYTTSQRNNTVWSSDALEAIHALLGPEFYMLAGLGKGRVENYLEGDERLDKVLSLARKEPGAVILRKS